MASSSTEQELDAATVAAFESLGVISFCGTSSIYIDFVINPFFLGVDAQSRPILVVAASNLPNPKEHDYDQLLKYMMSQLQTHVESDYVLIVLYSGMKFRPSFGWLKQAYTSLDRSYKKNLKQLYVVHPSMLHKIVLKFLDLLISSKFYKKMVYINSLQDLAQYVPIDNLTIPTIVRQYDQRRSPAIPLIYLIGTTRPFAASLAPPRAPPRPLRPPRRSASLAPPPLPSSAKTLRISPPFCAI